VASIDREAGTVAVDGDDGRYRESYDELLLATGGSAALPDVPGRNLTGVFSIRSLEAGRALKHYIAPHDAPPSPRAPTGTAQRLLTHLAERDLEAVAVVGANKIGVELAEAFVGRGLDVHVFDEAPRVLPSFGADVAGMVEDHLREAGLDLLLETPVTGFRGSNRRISGVETADGVVPVDAVVADVGVEPNVDLATAAGIDCGPTGAIATDEYGLTNDRTCTPPVTAPRSDTCSLGEPVHWPFALAANRAGRAIGRTLAGRPTPVGASSARRS